LNSVPAGRLQSEIMERVQNAQYEMDDITVAEVIRAVGDLSPGKACGLDTLTAEHFKYANRRLVVLLSLCFNSMLVHGYVPKRFSDSILVPILKDKKGDITDVDNYRPIAITSVASKIFEKIMLLRMKHMLQTNDNQFSYKSNHSTEMCIFALKSIVDLYITSSSPVFLCYVESAKAFDRVNFWCLFDKLLKRHVPIVFVRFLMIWYCTQEFIVR